MNSVQLQFSESNVALEEVPDKDFKAILKAVALLSEYGIPLAWTEKEDYRFESKGEPFTIAVTYGAEHYTPSIVYAPKDKGEVAA